MNRIGIDIIEITRFSEMKNLNDFLRRNFTKRERTELSQHKNPVRHIAGSFAAKEAFSKYSGSGIRGFKLCDIELLHNDCGKPYIMFKGNKVNADVSISHNSTTAVAVVCGDLEGDYTTEDIRLKYKQLLPVRQDNMHKGDCGRIFILAGSVGMTGAACLCTKAALRSGSGLVTLGTPKSAQPIAAPSILEAMTLPLPEEGRYLSRDGISEIRNQASKSDVCAIGPGLGNSSDIHEIVSELLKGNTPCILDADALNALSEDLTPLKNKSCPVIITPHSGEMSKLSGIDISEIENNRINTASAFANEYNCVVVLKGHNTVIASPKGEVTVNPTGNSGMASGGMGDVLTGIISSFAGQGLTLYNAAVLGVFLHGLAADIAVCKTGKFSLIAGDVTEYLPAAINYIS